MEKDFQYYGLFLTEESKKDLIQWLQNSSYWNFLFKSDRDFLDHCTLLHRSQNNPELQEILEDALKEGYSRDTIIVDGIGYNAKSLAFRVKKGIMCANEVPHITICTFKGGSPKDSNTITNWRTIPPIEISVIFKKV